MSIRDRVNKVLTDEMELLEQDIDRNSDLKKDLGLDSLEMTELTLAIEEEFGIDVDDGDAEGILTVENLVNYVEGRMK